MQFNQHRGEHDATLAGSDVSGLASYYRSIGSHCCSLALELMDSVKIQDPSDTAVR